ncbi:MULTISPECIES: hypothetical protein [Neisseria]|uniref:Lipoprotein n=1 Tax=Neisseria musculi TaxID=1815583 RepID=A0A7H1MB54_9NEIS|nr:MULTISPECIES: hypothetical protein [Neisseria]MBF0803850.1 hypothetical protein [Neisseria sp. 19428wB4_WF04]QNT58869.1 hypothetical protein H7A79_2751 [Neisseria musculi]TFU43445.1 hypothetical protein E4T99_05690 [Neisseria sp. WF04]
MKHPIKILSLALTAVVLSACGSTKVSVAEGKAGELESISRICIIPNAKRTPKGLENVIARSLKKHGIDSEIVNVSDRKRLYTPECRYNLRYVSAGSPQMIEKITIILRTPDYGVATIGYNVSDDPAWRSMPDLQKQTNGIIARLLGKNTQ